MGSQHVLSIEVVGIGETSTGVVGGKSQVVKVLLDGYDRGKRVQVGEGREVGFDECAEDTERVIGVEVEVAIQFREDCRSYIRVIISRIGSFVDDQGSCFRMPCRVVPSKGSRCEERKSS